MSTYSIKDVVGYATEMRQSVASSFKEDYKENLDDFISIDQTISVIENNSLGSDDNGYFLIDEDGHDQIFEEISIWIFNVGLAKLAANGHIECAWDSDLNEMIFWLADNKVSNNEYAKNHRTQDGNRQN